MDAKATPETVNRAADALLAVGISPTIELIIKQTGGSKSTVGPLLNAWRERRSGTPQAVHQAEVAKAEQHLHNLIQDLTRALGIAEQRITAAEADAQAALADAQAARAEVTAANQLATQVQQERNAALAALAGTTNIASDVAELRRMAMADVIDRRRTRATIVTLSRQVAALTAKSNQPRR